MCTAISFKTKDHYFGRNLDLEYSYDEKVTITPRNYVFNFRKIKHLKIHYAIIGMAYVKDNYPLYYDATNEMGLSMAGLNFPENAHYFNEINDKINISPFEFIPFILSTCKSVSEVKELLKRINLINISFSSELPLSPLHWIVSDKKSSLTIESVKDGLKVYENNLGILTNNPPFEIQMFNLNNYINLSAKDPENKFCKGLTIYSRGMGAIGLPGDWSSQSRFVKTVFVKNNSVCKNDETSSVNQFFHMLSSVEMPKGCVKVNKKDEYTIYSSCCNTDKGVYYYKTYEGIQINAVKLYNENLDGNSLISYPLIKNTVNLQN